VIKSDLERTLKVFCYHSENQCFLKIPSEEVTTLLSKSFFFSTILISFINQVNKKYDPGILLPLLLGKYCEAKEEDRIFMFMDLKSSTATAERLGHLKYSAFIRDYFSDINDVLYRFRAQVYQYVGDEIVVTWPESED